MRSTNEPVHSGITALQENAQETLFDSADGLVLSFRFRFGAGVHLGHGLLQGLPSDTAYFGITFQPEADCLPWWSWPGVVFECEKFVIFCTRPGTDIGVDRRSKRDDWGYGWCSRGARLGDCWSWVIFDGWRSWRVIHWCTWIHRWWGYWSRIRWGMSPTSVVIRVIVVEAFRRNVTKIGGVMAVVEEVVVPMARCFFLGRASSVGDSLAFWPSRFSGMRWDWGSTNDRIGRRSGNGRAYTGRQWWFHSNGLAGRAMVFNGVGFATNGKRSQLKFWVQDHMSR